jgi:hypothetical protein
MSVVNKQIKSVAKNFPYYLGNCLIVNNCPVDAGSNSYNILRVEALIKGHVKYLDVIIDGETQVFLGLGQCSDKQFDFDVSINICKTLNLVDYLEEAY